MCPTTYTHQSIDQQYNVTLCLTSWAFHQSLFFHLILCSVLLLFLVRSELQSSFGFIYLQAKSHFRTPTIVTLSYFLIFSLYANLQLPNTWHIDDGSPHALMSQELEQFEKRNGNWQDQRLKEEEEIKGLEGAEAELKKLKNYQLNIFFFNIFCRGPAYIHHWIRPSFQLTSPEWCQWEASAILSRFFFFFLFFFLANLCTSSIMPFREVLMQDFFGGWLLLPRNKHIITNELYN